LPFQKSKKRTLAPHISQKKKGEKQCLDGNKGKKTVGKKTQKKGDFFLGARKFGTKQTIPPPKQKKKRKNWKS